MFRDTEYSVQKVKEYIVRNKKKYPYLGGNKICNYWLYVMEPELVPIDVHTPMWLWSRGKFVVEI